ncbi:condensation domain-containing protein [Mycolicibacterium sp. CBM1]
MLVGPIEIGPIDDWEPGPGSLVSWQPTPASRAKALNAPSSTVPPSYIQTRHVRGLVQQAARGIDHSRLMIFSCRMPDRCDIRAMTYLINAHLRRHDTYRSWFEYIDDDNIARRTLADPADIEVKPTRHGELDSAELRAHVLATPDCLHWDCFGFGVIQCDDHFTFYAAIDHLHVDGQFVGVGLIEFRMMYAALASGAAPTQLLPAGSYDNHCVAQREHTSALTLDSPEVRAWVDFAEKNQGTFPEFPLPLGDPAIPYDGDLLTVELMDEDQTQRFEAVCVESGARFIGGLFAAVALALYELTGSATYCGLTPMDTRSTPEEYTTQGWFTGLVPVTVPVSADSFGATARAAQESFDVGRDLIRVPFERVVELAPELKRPRPLFAMLNYFDAGAGPLAPLLTGLPTDTAVAAYSDGRLTYPLSTMVGRFRDTVVTMVFPKNPVARQSVTAYVEALTSVCHRVADGHGDALVRQLSETSGQPS